MPAILRNFLYLDDRLTSQYLAQLEGGTYVEEAQSLTDARNRGAEAGAGFGGLNARGARGGSTEEVTSRTVKQTPEGNYRRLEKLLDEQEGVQWLDAFDEEIWNALELGEALLIKGKLTVPSFVKAAAMAEGIGPLMELMEAFGETVDREAEAAIQGMTQLGKTMKDVSVVARAAGAPNYRFVCRLKRDYLREDLSAMDGDCTVVGTLERRLKTSEKYSLLDDLGIGGMPRAERRKLERDMKKDMPDAVVSAPAAVVLPVAIYR
jgi:hypothetical protein